MPIDTITWSQGRVTLIDQTRLPMQVVYLHPETVQEMWQAIRDLQVRGAPAIGIAAAFGVYLAAVQSSATSVEASLTDIDAAVTYLASARPTAVNLFWALQRIQHTAHSEAKDKNANVNTLRQALLHEARQMIDEDNAVCLAIGQHGLSLLRPNMGLLTHCNAGGLGTAGWGTALAPIYLAHEKGWPLKVFADETRPVLQGARLTAWELQTAGIDVTLICDNMAGMVMQQGWVQAVIVGCDRVSANGDAVNKIGTYSLAILAQHHGLPFYVAAPRSSIDLTTAQGSDVVIEERNAAEVTEWCGQRSAPPGVKVYNPAFDVTPAELITAYITEVGVLKPPFPAALAKACAATFTGPKHV